MKHFLGRHPSESWDLTVLLHPVALLKKKRDPRFRGDDECGERRSAEHGFTLVELMVVIVIIGLLATIVAINVIPATDTARVEKAKADIATIEQALEQYRLDNLTYPAGSDGLQALLSPPASLTQPQRYRRGGYVKKLPDDPWGRAYVYTVPGRKGAFDISSLGADGQPGGEAENADIFSSEL
jgi:general secretion pathway protein G